jgi:hypothetical protein
VSYLAVHRLRSRLAHRVGSGRTTRKAGVGLPEQFHTAPAKSERLSQEELCNGERLSKGGCVTETRS